MRMTETQKGLLENAALMAGVRLASPLALPSDQFSEKRLKASCHARSQLSESQQEQILYRSLTGEN